MKYIFRIFSLALAVVLAAGCNTKYDVIENGLFINEAAPSDRFTQQVVNITVNGVTTTTIHLRLAQPLDVDVHATLALAPEFTEEYNSKNGTNYVTLPEEYVEFPAEVVIPAGSISSGDVEITINEIPSGDGLAYCLPIKVAGSDSPVQILEASGRLIYLITAPLHQTVPTMDSGTLPAKSEDAADWGVETNAWTLEAWVWMSAFPINNQAIFNAPVSKGTEIYIRFGDANVDYDKLQIKTYGSQFNSNTAFEPETWYHVAFVCGNGKCIMYINGQEDASMDLSSTDYIINNLQLCSSGSYFRANCKMAQVRFWNTALTANAIKDAMNREVPATSENLIGYWKLNEGEGSVYYDATSNGRDLVCAQAPTWTGEVIDFSNPNASAE